MNKMDFESKKKEGLSILKNFQINFPDVVFKTKFSKFSFFDFDYIFSQYFFDAIQKYLEIKCLDKFTFYTISPDPETFYFSNFGNYGLEEFTKGSSYEDYLMTLDSKPKNGSEADTIKVSSQRVLLYTSDLNVAIYADRAWEIGVFGTQDNELRIVNYFEEDMVEVKDYAKSNIQYFGQFSEINFKLNEFYNDLIRNYSPASARL